MSSLPRTILRKIRAAASAVGEALAALVAPQPRPIPIPVRVRKHPHRDPR